MAETIRIIAPESLMTFNVSTELFGGNPVPPMSLQLATTYYSLRRDLRRCAFPKCGGYFVKRINHPLTRCFDGKLMKECYIAEIDWNTHPQVEARDGLLRGRIATKRYGRSGKFGKFSVAESWQAAGTQAPAGVFYLVKDRGLRCVTHPCLTHYEAQLNTSAKRNIAGVDLSGAGAPESKIEEASAAMAQADGIILAGSHVPVTGPAGKSYTLKASQFYLRVKKQVGLKPTKPCMRTGCSKQVCADTDVITTCEWRPEYACYKNARCERQADGNCGFTMTRELRECLGRQ